LAPPAGLRTDFAMLHPHLPMVLAFGPAVLAGRGADRQHGPDETQVELGSPREDPSRRLADIGAVHTEVDALTQVGDAVLGDAGDPDRPSRLRRRLAAGAQTRR